MTPRVSFSHHPGSLWFGVSLSCSRRWGVDLTFYLGAWTLCLHLVTREAEQAFGLR